MKKNIKFAQGPSEKKVVVDKFKILEKVRKTAASLCQEEGFKLVSLEYLEEPTGKILRLCIDKPGGITLDNCADVSKQFSDILDVEWIAQDSYRLEVSSPGCASPSDIMD